MKHRGQLLSTVRGGLPPCQPCHVKAKGTVQSIRATKPLPRENLGGREDGDLTSSLEERGRRKEAEDGFPGPDVPLNKSLHRTTGDGEVGLNLVKDPPLRGRQSKWKPGFGSGANRRLHACSSHPRPREAIRERAQLRCPRSAPQERDLKDEQVVDDKSLVGTVRPGPKRGQVRPRRWKVNDG